MLLITIIKYIYVWIVMENLFQSLQIPELLLKITMIIYTVFLAYAIIGNTF